MDAIEWGQRGIQHMEVADFATAEAVFSQALVHHTKSSLLYTHRAASRVALRKFHDAALDCKQAMNFDPNDLFADLWLLSVQWSLGEFETAAETASKLYCKNLAQRLLPLVVTTEYVVTLRKLRWQQRNELRLEKERSQRHFELGYELAGLLDWQRGQKLSIVGHSSPYQMCYCLVCSEIMAEYGIKSMSLLETFEQARAQPPEQKQELPDWAIDPISLEFMVDPVVTPLGTSYERASILKHLEERPYDPLTRKPIKVKDLRPNIALRRALEEYLANNGWAGELDLIADWDSAIGI